MTPATVARFPEEASPRHGLSFFWIHAPHRAADFFASVVADINACSKQCTIAWPGTSNETAYDQIISLKGVVGMATGSHALCLACDQLLVDLVRGADRVAMADRYIEIARQGVALVERFASRIRHETGQDPVF